MKLALKKAYWLMLLCAALLTVFSAMSQERATSFSAFEEEAEILLNEQFSQDATLVELDKLVKKHSPLSPAEEVYSRYLQCSLNADTEVSVFRQLAQDQAQSQSVDLKVAAYLCQYVNTDKDSADENQKFQNAYLAYTNQSDIASAPLRYLAGYYYAEESLKAGLQSEGIKATATMLEIATANKFKNLQSMAYTLRAIFQAELSLFDAALENNQYAIDATQSLSDWSNRMLDRGFILTQAERYDEAIKVYEEVLAHPKNKGNVQFELIVASNLSFIYSNRLEKEKNLEITKRMMELAEETGSVEQIQWAKISRAYALLEAGFYQEGTVLFERANAWFIDNNYDLRTAERYENWAVELYAQEYYQEAYEYLLKSVELYRDIEARRGNKEVAMVKAVLETEKKQRELFQARQAIVLAEEKRHAQIIQFITMFSGLLLLVVVGTFFYFKLKAVNRKLDDANSALEYENNHDPLTGAYNRRFFYRFIEEQQSTSNSQKFAILALLDIDHFKSINDTYGHEAGDQVLQLVVKRLKNTTKDGDRLIRWGGEEFLLYMNVSESSELLSSGIYRVLNEINSNPFSIDGQQLRVTVSMGFIVTDIASSLEQALKQIDGFLYEAKRNGRQRAMGLLSIDTGNDTPQTIVVYHP